MLVFKYPDQHWFLIQVLPGISTETLVVLDCSIPVIQLESKILVQLKWKFTGQTSVSPRVMLVGEFFVTIVLYESWLLLAGT